MRRHLFLSYASEDHAAAEALYGALSADGLRCWMAPRDVAPGAEYASQIVAAISSARLLVILLSEAANKSPHVRREVERAASLDVPILTVRIEDVVPSSTLEYFLASTQWLDAVGDGSEAPLSHVGEAVQALLSPDTTPAGVPARQGSTEGSDARGAVRYVQLGADEVAYSVRGAGPVDMLHIPGLLNHIESARDEPALANHYAQLASFTRLVTYDRRGTGMSSPMRADQALSLEDRAQEALAVLDDLHIDHATVFATADGVPVAIFLAATHPERVSALVLYAGTARVTTAQDYPEGLDPDFVRDLMTAEFHRWGNDSDPTAFALIVPSRYGDPSVASSVARMERLAGTPRAAHRFFELFLEADIRHILASVQQRVLVLHNTSDLLVPVAQGRWLASRLRRAEYVELDGTDHFYFWDRGDDIVREVRRFLAVGPKPISTDRVLATVLALLPLAGPGDELDTVDPRTRASLDRFGDVVRAAITSYGGKELDSTGPARVAVFDAPSRAVLCGRAIQLEGMRADVEVGIGLHTGEVEVQAEQVLGATVDHASAIASAAEPGQVLVSRLVRDLVGGTGIRFADMGEHVLPGESEPWALLAVEG